MSYKNNTWCGAKICWFYHCHSVMWEDICNKCEIKITYDNITVGVRRELNDKENILYEKVLKEKFSVMNTEEYKNYS